MEEIIVDDEIDDSDKFKTFRIRNSSNKMNIESTDLSRKNTLTRKASLKRNSKRASLIRRLSILKNKKSNDNSHIPSPVDDNNYDNEQVKHEQLISIGLESSQEPNESNNSELQTDKPEHIGSDNPCLHAETQPKVASPILCDSNLTQQTVDYFTARPRKEFSQEFLESFSRKSSFGTGNDNTNLPGIDKSKAMTNEKQNQKDNKMSTNDTHESINFSSNNQNLLYIHNPSKMERSTSHFLPVSHKNNSSIHRSATFKLGHLNYYKSPKRRQIKKAIKESDPTNSVDSSKSSGNLSILQRINLLREQTEAQLNRNKKSPNRDTNNQSNIYIPNKEAEIEPEVKEKEEMIAYEHCTLDQEPHELDILPPAKNPINSIYTITQKTPTFNSQLNNTNIDAQIPTVIKLENLPQQIPKQTKPVLDNKKRIYSSLLPAILESTIEEIVDQQIASKTTKEKKLKKLAKKKKDILYLDKHNPVKMLLQSERSILEAIYQWLLDEYCKECENNENQPNSQDLSDTNPPTTDKSMREKTNDKIKKNDDEATASQKHTSIFNDQEWESLKTICQAATSTQMDEEFKPRQRRLSEPNTPILIPRDDMKSYQDLKQTLLKYEAKIRQLINDKGELIKQLERTKDYNTSLQKRQYTLHTEYKQEKKEIFFIKNQIGIMLSRIQTLPDKLEQLEAENVNLKSELKDAEKTLTQRDQLFASERQINASLSEEIIKLESESVNKDLMKNVCEEFENLNEEYEDLKTTLAATEDKLYELAEDRDNLLKHSKILEDHLFKLKAENNYYQLITSNSNGFGDNSLVDTATTNSKPHDDHHHCHRSRSHRRHRRSPSLSSSSSSYSSNSSSSSSPRRHSRHRKSSKSRSKSKKRHHSSGHGHVSKSKDRHKHRSKSKSSKKGKSTDLSASQTASNTNNAVSDKPKEPEASNSQFVMPNNLEELKKLENIYDNIQMEKSRLEGALSHIPTNKGISGSGNLSNMREQEGLEHDLDKVDKKLASLRKILKQCKVFKSISS